MQVKVKAEWADIFTFCAAGEPQCLDRDERVARDRQLLAKLHDLDQHVKRTLRSADEHPLRTPPGPCFSDVNKKMTLD